MAQRSPVVNNTIVVKWWPHMAGFLAIVGAACALTWCALSVIGSSRKIEFERDALRREIEARDRRDAEAVDEAAYCSDAGRLAATDWYFTQDGRCYLRFFRDEPPWMLEWQLTDLPYYPEVETP